MTTESSIVQHSWTNRKRNITRIVVTLIAIAFLATPFAGTFVSSESDATDNSVTEGGVTYDLNDWDGGETAMVTGCTLAEKGDIVIKDSVTIGTSKEVVRIVPMAFGWNENITSITIPNTITSIEDRAFEGCLSNAKFKIDGSPKSFGVTNDGFGLIDLGMGTLVRFAQAAVLPDNPYIVNYKIGPYAFSECTNLKMVEFGAEVTNIDTCAFVKCSSLTDVTIPATVGNIGMQAFAECPSIMQFFAEGAFNSIDGVLFDNSGTLIQYPAGKDLKVYNVPSDALVIMEGAFAGCTNLTDVVIPNTVTSIGEGSFGGCTSLKTINIENGSDYYTVDGILFDKNKNALLAYPAAKEDVTYQIPDGIGTILPSAFRETKFLQSVDLNDVTYIKTGAFLYSSLTSVEIPSTVTDIEWNAFQECMSMRCITFDAGCGQGGIGIHSSAFIGFTFMNDQGNIITTDQYSTALPDHSFTGDSISQMKGTQEGTLFNVYFDVDGGTKKVEPLKVGTGEKITLPQYDGTKDGFKFVGWLYNGEPHQPGDVVDKVIGGCVTINAIWEPVAPPQPNVIFDEAGGSIHLNPIYVEDGKQFTLPEYKGTKDGFEFAGWSYNNVVYQPGKVLTKDVSGTMKITAVWTPIEEPVSGSSSFDFLPLFFGVMVALIVLGSLVTIVYDNRH